MSLDPICGRAINSKQSEWLLVREEGIEADHFCSAECRQEFLNRRALAAAINSQTQPTFRTMIDLDPAPGTFAPAAQELALAA